jgi:autotransporter-associated beta strand protein
VTTILAGLGGEVNNNGLRGGSAIAFDTANAAGGNFGITNILANSTGTGSGSLGITKLGAGTLTLSGANTFSGALDVRTGTVDLASTVGAAAGSAGSISISSSAVLLLSQSEQLNDGAAVTLSGGTIARASGVSEVFGNLNITAGSFLDFGNGISGTLQFQNYANTGSSLVAVQNFFPGNKLQFTKTSFGSGDLANFGFGGADYTTGIEGNYFTITAIPEPSTVATALGLLAMLGWPATRRWLRKS